MQNWAGNHTYVRGAGAPPDERRRAARDRRRRSTGCGPSAPGTRSPTSPTRPGDLVSTQDARPGHRGRRRPRAGAGRRRASATACSPSGSPRGGWALATMASLPHISVAGAVATGTHGSGDRTGSLAAAVAGLELVGADGELRTVARGEPDFDGSVVSLGALGIVTHVTLDVEPTYDVRQDLYTDLPWDVALEHLDELTAQRLQRQPLHRLGQRLDPAGLAEEPRHRAARRPARAPRPATRDAAHAGRRRRRGGHPAGRGQRARGTGGCRTSGWSSRRAAGEELQSEYLVPARRGAGGDRARCCALAPAYAALLQVSEIRTVAADRLWLSGAYDRDVVGFHFTWVRDVPGVYAVLPAIEEALLPLGGRPHWGKCFAAGSDALRPLYPRFDDFRDLAARVDPTGKFRNAFLARTLPRTSGRLERQPRTPRRTARSTSPPATASRSTSRARSSRTACCWRSTTQLARGDGLRQRRRPARRHRRGRDRPDARRAGGAGPGGRRSPTGAETGASWARLEVEVRQHRSGERLSSRSSRSSTVGQAPADLPVHPRGDGPAGAGAVGGRPGRASWPSRCGRCSASTG